jgi:hypothetical protein
MKRVIVVAAAAALCVGCAAQPIKITTSDVAPASDGNFLVVAKPSDNTDWTDIQVQALKSADNYCVSKGKQMHQMSVETHGTSGWGQQEYALTFRCGSRSESTR